MSLSNVNLGDLIEFANQWSSLGSAVTDQVESLALAFLIDDEPGEINPEAIRDAQRQLRERHEVLDAVFAEYFHNLKD